MGFLKKIKNIITNLSDSFEYYVLLKKKYFNPLESDFLSNFSPVKTGLHYWTADPFLFEYDGEHYIFAELGDRFSWKGRIGCLKIRNLKGKWRTCIKERWHLSFPNVFWFNGELTMLCESSERGGIYFYKCISFPNKWKRIDTLLISGRYVDSDVFNYKGKQYLICYLDLEEQKYLHIYVFGERGLSLIQSIEDDRRQMRAAGKVYCLNDTYYYPSQDCSASYGQAVIVNELRMVDEHFVLEPLKRISSSDFAARYGRTTYHLHTINHDSKYVVIDASRPCRSFYVMIRRLSTMVCRIPFHWRRSQ